MERWGVERWGVERWGWVHRFKWGGGGGGGRLKVTKTVSIQMTELPFIEPQLVSQLHPQTQNS